jgi:hypothetical protein
VIRFSAGLVVVAIGVLIGGIATSKLLLVYVAIGLSAAALLALAIGVALKREELFGEQRQVLAPAADASAGKSFIQPNGAVDTPPARVPAATPMAFGEAFPGSGGTAHRAGQSPSDRPGALGYSGFGQPGLPARETPPVREGLVARDGSGSGGGSHYARPGAPGYGAGRAGQDMTRPERYAGPFRLDSPGAPATPAAPAAAARPATPAAPAAAARPAAQASNAASAPPVSPVTPPPATSPPFPVPPWRERLSPPDGDPLSSAASSRAESGSRPGPGSSAPDWPSWFDRQTRLARDDAAADDTGAASRVPPAVAADDADSGASATTPEAAKDSKSAAEDSKSAAEDDTSAAGDSKSAAEDSKSAAEDGASADADPALSASADADPPLGASTEADPALSTAAETDDAEAGELGHPADPESSSDYELPSDLVSADTASTDEADPADDTAGSGEQWDDEPTAGRGSGSGQVTVVPGVPRYHKQNCILIRFMADEDMQKMTIQEAAETGCTPCRACQPAPA